MGPDDERGSSVFIGEADTREHEARLLPVIPRKTHPRIAGAVAGEDESTNRNDHGI